MSAGSSWPRGRRHTSANAPTMIRSVPIAATCCIRARGRARMTCGMNEQLGFATIGAGYIARTHAAAISQAPGARLVAVQSIVPQGVLQATTTAFPGLFERLELCGSRGGVLVENGKVQ